MNTLTIGRVGEILVLIVGKMGFVGVVLGLGR